MLSHLRLLLILSLIAFGNLGLSEDKPNWGFTLNPALKLRAVQSPKVMDFSKFNNFHFENDQLDIFLISTPVSSPKLAEQVLKINFSNLKKLYRPSANPYKGEISDLVRCDQRFHPEASPLAVAGQTTELLIGGVNGRKAFGACSQKEISHFASFFSFYNPELESIFEVRVIQKKKGNSTKDFALAKKELKKISEELFQHDLSQK